MLYPYTEGRGRADNISRSQHPVSDFGSSWKLDDSL